MFLRSFAKLNLYLRVCGRRPDNYHDIRTVFERISIFDTISIKARRDTRINIECNSPLVPSGKDNLAFRAARILQDKFKARTGADIKIIKRIPPGAGMGGGSSNAASVLLGLNRLWNLKLGIECLLKCARLIGSDVAFFIHDCSFAEGRGRGDNVRPLRALEGLRLWHVIAVPPLAVRTPLIYRKIDTLKLALTRPFHDVKILSLALEKGNRSLIKQSLYNSLEPVTFKIYPDVGRIKEEFLKAGAEGVLMSGSGSSVFALTSGFKESILLARRLKKEGKSWNVFISHTS
ncbi:MAG: 4-(cytidine 5'-diphospho)-2-C-methyl-D-erythritol kinase [Candidatus Omnitrophota bacterium]